MDGQKLQYAESDKEKVKMIPKKIHYCWFGRRELPEKAKRCIESWKQFCPDYEVMEWNEDNINIGLNSYTKWCYENKKFAFLSDYIRLLVIERYGGIYFDTDVEVIRAFDDLLGYPAFFGFETDKFVNTGVGFGAEAHNSMVKQMIREYDPLLDGQQKVIGCPHLNTNALLKFGLRQNGELQKLNEAVVFPIEYFNPYDASTGQLKKSAMTYSIHWYAASWMGKKQKVRSFISKPLHRVFGKDFFRKIQRGSL